MADDLPRNALAQDLDALGRSLPERTEPPSFFGPDAQANPWRQRIEAPLRELQYALMYPVRVADRYAARQRTAGSTPSWTPQREDGSISSDLHPVLANQLAPLLRGVDAMDFGYKPGEISGGRESENVEVRRPTSIWQYR